MNKLLILIGLLILGFGTVLPLFHPSYFPMHDDTQPARVYEMTTALRSGQFPVRWVGDLGYGYGYPLFNFYAPFPYYVGALFQLVGFDPVSSAKLMMGIGMLIATFTMFFLGKRLGGVIIGFVSAILYSYAPYHAVDLFVRGAVGELFAYAFIPLFLLGIYELYSRKIKIQSLKMLIINCRTGIGTTIMGLALILLSHNILGMVALYIVTLLLIIGVLMSLVRRRLDGRLVALLISTVLTLGLTSFFILPAYLEKGITKVDTLITGGSIYSDHFVEPFQLWDSPWGFGGSVPGSYDGLSYKIGKLLVVVAVMGIFALIIRIVKRGSILFWEIPAIVFTLLSLFLTLSYSEYIWNFIPGFSYIQYPWRLLVLVIAGCTIMTISWFRLLQKTLLYVASFGIVITYLIFNLKYFQPQTEIPYANLDYTSKQSLEYKISKISDEYMPKNFIPPSSNDELQTRLSNYGDVLDVQVVKDVPTRKIYQITVDNSDVLSDVKIFRPHIAVFPGWIGMVDNHEVSLKEYQGEIELPISAGIHHVELVLKNTLIRQVGNAISLLTLFLIVYGLFFLSSKAYETTKLR